MVVRKTNTSEEKYKVKVHVGSRAGKHDRYCKRLTNQEAFQILKRSKFKLKKKVYGEKEILNSRRSAGRTNKTNMTDIGKD